MSYHFLFRIDFFANVISQKLFWKNFSKHYWKLKFSFIKIYPETNVKNLISFLLNGKSSPYNYKRSPKLKKIRFCGIISCFCIDYLQKSFLRNYFEKIFQNIIENSNFHSKKFTPKLTLKTWYLFFWMAKVCKTSYWRFKLFSKKFPPKITLKTWFQKFTIQRKTIAKVEKDPSLWYYFLFLNRLCVNVIFQELFWRDFSKHLIENSNFHS